MVSKENGVIRINDSEEHLFTSYVTGRNFDFKLPNKDGIRIYCFNSLMFSFSEDKEKDTFIFQGPKLGLYYKAIDIRESPVVNHFIEKLEIQINYTPLDARISVKGNADLSKSFFHQDYFNGKKEGRWAFIAEFTHVFPRTRSC